MHFPIITTKFVFLISSNNLKFAIESKERIKLVIESSKINKCPYNKYFSIKFVIIWAQLQPSSYYSQSVDSCKFSDFVFDSLYSIFCFQCYCNLLSSLFVVVKLTGLDLEMILYLVKLWTQLPTYQHLAEIVSLTSFEFYPWSFLGTFRT